jgi:hypothetical protein
LKAIELLLVCRGVKDNGVLRRIMKKGKCGGCDYSRCFLWVFLTPKNDARVGFAVAKMGWNQSGVEIGAWMGWLNRKLVRPRLAFSRWNRHHMLVFINIQV